MRYSTSVCLLFHVQIDLIKVTSSPACLLASRAFPPIGAQHSAPPPHLADTQLARSFRRFSLHRANRMESPRMLCSALIRPSHSAACLSPQQWDVALTRSFMFLYILTCTFSTALHLFIVCVCVCACVFVCLLVISLNPFLVIFQLWYLPITVLYFLRWCQHFPSSVTDSCDHI